MAARCFLPLILLLVLIWNEGTTVECQTVHVNKVSTDYVELTWKRTENWLGIKVFKVVFKTPNSNVCEEAINCQTSVCSFDSSQTCGLVKPCSQTTTTITGSNYSAPPVLLVTSSEPVTNVTLNLDQGIEHITWKNPPIGTSPCYKDSAVKVVYFGVENTTYHEVDEEYQDVELCRDVGTRNVEVWTRGGDGESSVFSSQFIYNVSSVVDLVEVKSCEALNCTSYQVSWDYLPVCSKVERIWVEIEDSQSFTPVNTTNDILTGVKQKLSQDVCVRAQDGHGHSIDVFCGICYSAGTGIRNLRAKPRNINSMKVTWDPQLCNITDIGYNIKYTTASGDRTWTSSYENSIILENLSSFQYTVCVETAGGDPKVPPNCITAFTSISAPSIANVAVLENDSIHVTWYYDETPYTHNTIAYQVTWGTNLQYKGRTQEKSFIIMNYTATNAHDSVCVAAFPINHEDLMSAQDCLTSGPGDVTDGPEDYSSLGLIIGLSVSGAIIVLMVITVIAVKLRKRPHHASTTTVMRPIT